MELADFGVIFNGSLPISSFKIKHQSITIKDDIKGFKKYESLKDLIKDNKYEGNSIKYYCQKQERSTSYESFTIKDFNEYLEHLGFQKIKKENNGEWVWKYEVNEKYSIEIYLTIPLNEFKTRSARPDAIRVLTFHNDLPFPDGSTRNINRNQHSHDKIKKDLKLRQERIQLNSYQYSSCGGYFIQKKYQDK